MRHTPGRASRFVTLLPKTGRLRPTRDRGQGCPSSQNRSGCQSEGKGQRVEAVLGRMRRTRTASAVTTEKFQPGGVLLYLHTQHRAGNFEIVGHRHVRAFAACCAIQGDGVLLELLRVRRLTSTWTCLLAPIKIHCQSVHSKGSASQRSLSE